MSDRAYKSCKATPDRPFSRGQANAALRALALPLPPLLVRDPSRLPANLPATVHCVLKVIKSGDVQRRIAVPEDAGIFSRARIAGEKRFAAHADLIFAKQERIYGPLCAGDCFVLGVKFADVYDFAGGLLYDFDEKSHWGSCAAAEAASVALPVLEFAFNSEPLCPRLQDMPSERGVRPL